jgi:signal transduction histidine kinase
LAGGSPRLQDRILHLLLGILVVASVALAALTTTIHVSTGALRSKRQALISPGVRSAQDLIIGVSLEFEAFVRYELGRETEALTDFRRHGVARRSAMLHLDTVARQVGGDAWPQYQDLAGSIERWEALVARISDAGAPADDSDDQDRELDALSRAILVDATTLERTLYGELDRARAQIDAAEQLDWYLTLGLALVSLTASLFIAWLVRRIRYLARISEMRRSEAVKANADRARLLRGITHDVKNPLGAADGSAQLLEMGIGGSLSEVQRDTIRRIRRGIGGALTIVSDLLELSRAEGDSLAIETVPTDLGALLTETCEDYRPQAEASGVTLTTGIGPELPVLVTDDRRVRQIVGNLLSNAIKFTPPKGRISVSAEVRRVGSVQAVAIDVRDTGAGIPHEEQDRIFEEFYRAGAPGSRPAGTGVGLTISRRLARLLGGDLGVESEPGSGSVFTLWLPMPGSRVGEAPYRAPR